MVSDDGRTVDMIVYDNSVYTGAIVEQMDLPLYYSVNLNDKNQTLSSFGHILYLSLIHIYSILCKNPTDGITYKVLLNDLCISRYVDCGIGSAMR